MQPQPPDVPRGVWLGASIRLGHPVSADQPYPHVCVPEASPQAWRRDCPACVEAEQDTREPLHVVLGFGP